MAAMTQYLVRCDRCGQTPTTRWRPTFAQALRDAKAAGWDCDTRVRCRDCLNDEATGRGRFCRDGCHERGQR